MAEIDCYERQIFGVRWFNGYSVLYYNAYINEHHAKPVFEGNIIKKLYRRTLQELRRKMRND
mgnify:CR=1 FL=1